MNPPFSVAQPEIEKPRKRYLHIVPRSSDIKFHKILSNGCGEIASDGFLHKLPFSRDAASYLRIVPRSSDMKFYKIWSKGNGEMASDGQKILVKNNFLHDAPFFHDPASNSETEKKVFAHCSKEIRYEV